jgi:hypothetical protein
MDDIFDYHNSTIGNSDYRNFLFCLMKLALTADLTDEEQSYVLSRSVFDRAGRTVQSASDNTAISTMGGWHCLEILFSLRATVCTQTVSYVAILITLEPKQPYLFDSAHHAPSNRPTRSAISPTRLLITMETPCSPAGSRSAIFTRTPKSSVPQRCTTA